MDWALCSFLKRPDFLVAGFVSFSERDEDDQPGAAAERTIC